MRSRYLRGNEIVEERGRGKGGEREDYCFRNAS